MAYDMIWYDVIQWFDVHLTNERWVSKYTWTRKGKPTKTNQITQRKQNWEKSAQLTHVGRVCRCVCVAWLASPSNDWLLMFTTDRQTRAYNLATFPHSPSIISDLQHLLVCLSVSVGSSPSSMICQPEPSHCASLSTQHGRLSGVPLRRPAQQCGGTLCQMNLETRTAWIVLNG